MCTILLLFRVHPEYPLIVAANRDEFYERDTATVQPLNETGTIVGGRDLEKGGTWMGATRAGLFVGLTNQRTYTSLDAPRSRGHLVLDALAQPSHDAIAAHFQRCPPQEYAPCNVLFGDATQLSIAYFRQDQEAVEIEEVPPGMHVLPNDKLNTTRFPKTQRAHQLLETLSLESWPTLSDQLHQILADRERPALDQVPRPPDGHPIPHAYWRELEALCIRTPVYGTRSATMLALQPGRVAHYLYADGAPDQSTFDDVTSLLSPPPGM